MEGVIFIFKNRSQTKKVRYYEHLLEELIEGKYDQMYRIAYSYVYDHEDALDILQDSFQKALKSFRKTVEIDNFQAWFYKILVRTAIDQWRVKRLRPFGLAFEETIELRHFRFDQSEFLELKEILERTPSPERDIIILKYFDGFTLQEIAQILNLNENTVKTKMYRSLVQFKHLLN